MLDLPIAQDGLHALRAQLAARAHALGMAPTHVATLKLIASELVSNAIRHGGGTGRVILWRHGSHIYCQVHDQGPGITDPNIGTTAPHLTANHGRGLWMCRQMTTDLIITRSADRPGTTVTAVIPAAMISDTHGGSHASHPTAPPDAVEPLISRIHNARPDHHADPGSHHRRTGRG